MGGNLGELLMPRKLRMEYEGAIYHVTNRGNRREKIFRDEADRERSPGQSCSGHEMAIGGLYQTVQSPAPTVRTFVCGTVQGIAGGWERRWLSANGL